MKKFSTYNGLFTGCPTFIPTDNSMNFNDTIPNNDTNQAELDNDSSNFNYAQNNEELQENTNNYEEPNQINAENYTNYNEYNAKNHLKNKEYVHYPQDSYNFGREANTQSNKQKEEANNTAPQTVEEKTNTTQNNVVYKASDNAQILLNCMRQHDKIMQNFGK